METTASKRIYSLDILRILAAFSVVLLHTTASYMSGAAIDSSTYRQALFVNSVSRYGVPFFVMISGIVFLCGTHEISYKKLWTHNIVRLFVIYIVWSSLYVAVDLLKGHTGKSISQIARDIINGKYHLWFLPMIMGIYVVLPLLKSWVDKAEKKEVEIFLAAFFALDLLINAIGIINNGKSYTISTFTDKVSFPLGEYVGYFVMGYYLWTFGIKKGVRIFLYILTPVLVFVNYSLAYKQSLEFNSISLATADCNSLLAFIEIIALFVFLCEIFKKYPVSEKSGRVLVNLSKSTLGEYLVHLMVLEFLFPYISKFTSIPVWLMSILEALLFFVISIIIAAVLRRIPKIGKYIC